MNLFGRFIPLVQFVYSIRMDPPPRPFRNIRFSFEGHEAARRPGPSQDLGDFLKHNPTDVPLATSIVDDLNVMGSLCAGGDGWMEEVQAMGASAPEIRVKLRPGLPGDTPGGPTGLPGLPWALGFQPGGKS